MVMDSNIAEIDKATGDALAGVRVFDSDGHFYEPAEVFKDYLEPRFRHAAPQLVNDNQGRVRATIAGKMLPYIPMPPAAETRPEKLLGAFEPAARLADMDRAGIDVMAIYPTKGLYFFGVEDPQTCAALCRAYNDWARDYVAKAPDRMLATAVLPQCDVGLMLEEARRVLGKGLEGAFLRPNPIAGRHLDDPALTPLWSLLEEMGAPLVLHEGTTQDVPQVGNDRYDNFLYKHMVSHPFEQMMGIMELVCGGVLERHPKLNVMISECGVGWAPYWIDRMDDHFAHWGYCSYKLKELPSYYFRRQVFISAEGNERLIPFVVSELGDDNICFSSDYPHPDHDFLGVVEGIKTMQGLSVESKRKILGENAARLFSR
jgi:predicted TIM-barrel fold metal-dependent hydrolase